MVGGMPFLDSTLTHTAESSPGDRDVSVMAHKQEPVRPGMPRTADIKEETTPGVAPYRPMAQDALGGCWRIGRTGWGGIVSKPEYILLKIQCMWGLLGWGAVSGALVEFITAEMGTARSSFTP